MELKLFASRLFGTPNEKSWDKIVQLPFYRHDFPQWPTLKLETIVPSLTTDGIALLEVHNNISTFHVLNASVFFFIENVHI